MSLSLPFGVGNGVNVSSGMENTYQFDGQSRWQFNGADPTADPSIYARQQTTPTSGGFGAYVRVDSFEVYHIDERYNRVRV
jgi:hypothetical protein